MWIWRCWYVGIYSEVHNKIDNTARTWRRVKKIRKNSKKLREEVPVEMVPVVDYSFMGRLRVWWVLFKVRLWMTGYIWFGSKRTMVLFRQDRQSLEDLISGNDFDVDVTFHGTRKPVLRKMVHGISASFKKAHPEETTKPFVKTKLGTYGRN